MELECSRITKIVIPAMRICIAEDLSRKYGLNQQQIAGRLGIAQVAVSKYLNGKSSAEVKMMMQEIRQKKLSERISEKASKLPNPDMVNELINDVCTKMT